ncbi:hypothetical protein MNB_SM-6-805 [hydrothermal vent metagenome]|uniref:Uncharacterized protein n=1 Tax=hydrothermal vent metagenome TaxID=652676 RepID=A0A1W1CCP0_9ZZZZ
MASSGFNAVIGIIVNLPLGDKKKAHLNSLNFFCIRLTSLAKIYLASVPFSYRR